jgi:hypothetical protein
MKLSRSRVAMGQREVFMPEERLEWRGKSTNEELNALRAEAFEHRVLPIDWVAQARAHSLGWVTARENGKGSLGSSTWHGMAGFMRSSWT